MRHGQVIIKQGDEGDSMYIISAGSVDIFVRRADPDGTEADPDSDGAKAAPDSDGAKVATFGPGDLFGELALMYSAPRAATVIVSSPECQLWRLQREAFKMLMVSDSQAKYELYEGWLAKVGILRGLNHYELSRLSEALEQILYDEDEVIIRQGDEGDRFYILEDGACAAFIEQNGSEVMVKEYKTQGEYFGEIALMTDEPRSATIRASAEGASVASITKDNFEALLGPVKGMLQQDITNYETPNANDIKG